MQSLQEIAIKLAIYNNPTPRGSVLLVFAVFGGSSLRADGGVEGVFIVESEDAALGSGCATVGSAGRGLEGWYDCPNGPPTGDRTEPHGLSSSAGCGLEVAHGLLVPTDKDSRPRETEDVSSPQAVRVSRPRSSAVLADDSPSFTPVLRRSFATPTYASCTTERAAEALDDSFPHTDLTPLLERKSGGFVRARLGENWVFGEGTRGGRIGDAPESEVANGILSALVGGDFAPASVMDVESSRILSPMIGPGDPGFRLKDRDGSNVTGGDFAGEGGSGIVEGVGAL